MASSVKNDKDIQLPVVTVVTASAGAGKTHALTHRYVQFLLSDKIPHNSLQNILAITFTNNAAAEMKQRILKLLKFAALGNESTLSDFREIISRDPSELREKAARCLGEIFDAYSDFQVRTIDSFMASVFTSASIEYGYHPGFEILLDTNTIFDRAFDVFARGLKENTAQSIVFEEIVRLISENRGDETGFLWDPYKKIRTEVKKLYELIAAQTKPLNAASVAGEMSLLTEKIKEKAAQLKTMIRDSGLDILHTVENDLASIASGDIEALFARTLKDTPVKKPKGKESTERHAQWIESLESELAQFNDLVRAFILCHARGYYQPTIDAYGMLRKTLDGISREQGQIFIGEVNKTLAEHLDVAVVPEIYFKLGETIHHYLIDEFQDTSDIQWRNMHPLIEESLSIGGSLYLVGDTKQSIYGFRDADWRIMKRMIETNEFPSAHHEVQTLDMNYRSQERIVRFNNHLFHDVIPSEGYSEEAAASGLSTFSQRVKSENEGKGHVEVTIAEEEKDAPPEKAKILAIVEECHARGYRYDEMAILTPTNNDVIQASEWLNERGIPFISYSTLDVRRRRSAGEFVALLRFLDSPLDDLSFMTFLLGDVFRNVCAAEGRALSREVIENLVLAERESAARPLYVAFRERFTGHWEKYFEHLFNVVGYFPIYDLISESYKIFDVFKTSPMEEGALAKLLEVVKTFEQGGTNTIKDFLNYAEDDGESEPWKIDAPKDVDALQVMTVHKAKGMEFPVVILLLRDQERRRGSFLLEEEEENVRVLHVDKKAGDKVEILKDLLRKNDFRETVDRLNKLYVACTRAEREMYVIGVYKTERKEPTRFFSETDYGPSRKPPAESGARERQIVLEAYHHTVRKALSVQGHRGIAAEETVRGDCVHRIVSAIEYLDDGIFERLHIVVNNVMRAMRYEGPAEEARLAVISLVSDSEVKRYFERREGRIVLREQEMTDAAGALYRADRIVVDSDEVTVIDFKTGGDENEADYVVQVSNYMAMLRDIYPARRVTGLLAYVDLKKTRSIP